MRVEKGKGGGGGELRKRRRMEGAGEGEGDQGGSRMERIKGTRGERRNGYSYCLLQ